jgi:hypothetical protein
MWKDRSPLAKAVAEHSGPEAEHQYRVFRASPGAWPQPESVADAGRNRQRAMARWERQTLAPRYHLLEREPALSFVESSTTMTSHDLAMFFKIARLNGYRRPGQVGEPHGAVVNGLSAKYVILPPDFSFPNHERLADFDGAVLWKNSYAWPRAWVVHYVRLGETPTRGDPLSLDWSTTWATASMDRPDPLAVVEPAEAIPGEMLLVGENRKLRKEGPAYGMSKIVVDRPQHIEIEAELEKPGLLVLSDLYYPGWAAEMRDEETGETSPLDIVRTNRIMRGVFLPAGRHRVTFGYRPRSFYWGAAISVIAWGALPIALAIGVGRRRRAEQARPLNEQLVMHNRTSPPVTSHKSTCR